MSSCCGGKCGCGSGCKCGSGCNGCGYSFEFEENTTSATLVMGVGAAPKVQYGQESGVAAEGGSSGCKCVNCTCDPCTCK